jgi:hypothetical protein
MSSFYLVFVAQQLLRNCEQMKPLYRAMQCKGLHVAEQDGFIVNHSRQNGHPRAELLRTILGRRDNPPYRP